MSYTPVTIHDIARLLNISASTVSRALNDHPRISKKTKEKVRQMAGELNYQPNLVASNLRSGKSKIIGILVPRINRYFFSNVIGGIEEVASSAGYKIMIMQSDESYKKEIESIYALLNARVDGILVSISIETRKFDHFDLIRKRGLPLIFFDRSINNSDFSNVGINDFSGGLKAVQHLISQGCRRIAHLAGPEHINIYYNRKKGFEKAHEEAGLPIDSGLVVKDAVTWDKGKEACEYLINLKNPPDAIFAASDFSAVGAMVCLKENGLKIPEDVAVVGYANEPFNAWLEPGLTSVDQHSNEIGKNAARLFLNEVGRLPEDSKSTQIILEPELIIRKSSVKKG